MIFRSESPRKINSGDFNHQRYTKFGVRCTAQPSSPLTQVVYFMVLFRNLELLETYEICSRTNMRRLSQLHPSGKIESILHVITEATILFHFPYIYKGVADTLIII
jgi:hypothetical protein